MTIGNTGKVMASINNLVLALIRQAKFHHAPQARRWFAAHLSKTFALLTTPFSGFWESHAITGMESGSPFISVITLRHCIKYYLEILYFGSTANKL